MSASNETGGIDPELLKRVESGRKIIMSCMATSLGGCFLIVGAQLKGDDVERAMYALVVSLPLLAIHYLVNSPGHEGRYQVSALMRATTVLGLLSMSIGLGFLFERGAPGAGALFGVFSFLCGMICVQSNDRAIAKARKKATPMKIAA